MLNNVISKIHRYDAEIKKVIIKNSRKNERTNGEYQKWRKLVYNRDKYTCQVCKRRNVRLNAHHILGFSKFRNLRYDVDNGITLCSSCHWKFHKKYGKSNFPNIKQLLNEGILEI